MRFALAILSLLIAGCGSNNSAPPAQPAPPPPPPLSCSTNFSWVAPTERVDNTPMGMDEISKFTLYGTRNGALDLIIDITDVMMMSWEIRHTPSGEWEFYMTVTDTNGLESDRSNLASKDVPEGC